MPVQLPTILIEVVGDSIPSLTTPGGVANLWTQNAQSDLINRFPGSNIILSNRAVPGTTTATHWTVQIPVSVANTPAKVRKFCLWFAWSPNDGVLATNINTAYNTYQSQFLAACTANGFIPILGTNIPCNGIATLTDDQARLACNALVLASASTTVGSEVIVADFDSAVSDHALPHANIISAYTLDGTHLLTAAGQAAAWPVLSNALATYLTSVGVT